MALLAWLVALFGSVCAQPQALNITMLVAITTTPTVDEQAIGGWLMAQNDAIKVYNLFPQTNVTIIPRIIPANIPSQIAEAGRIISCELYKDNPVALFGPVSNLAKNGIECNWTLPQKKFPAKFPPTYWIPAAH
jgi:hypothetical protein